MSIAYDPRPSVLPTPGSRYETPGLRDITDEVLYEEQPDEKPENQFQADDDWIRMYDGDKMEENY
jgi:hypothetical protein